MDRLASLGAWAVESHAHKRTRACPPDQGEQEDIMGGFLKANYINAILRVTGE